MTSLNILEFCEIFRMAVRTFRADIDENRLKVYSRTAKTHESEGRPAAVLPMRHAHRLQSCQIQACIDHRNSMDSN
jgi:hypothetical protein